MPSSTASSTTPIASISSATVCAEPDRDRPLGIDQRQTNRHKKHHQPVAARSGEFTAVRLGLGERSLSPLYSRRLTKRPMGEDAPFRPLVFRRSISGLDYATVEAGAAASGRCDPLTADRHRVRELIREWIVYLFGTRMRETPAGRAPLGAIAAAPLAPRPRGNNREKRPHSL